MKEEVFDWKAIDFNGVEHRGFWPASDISQINSRLRSLQYFPLDIKLRSKTKQAWTLMKKPQIPWGSFAFRLSVMLEAGIPLLTALHIMEQSERNTEKRQVLQQIGELIEAGSPLSDTINVIGAQSSVFIQSALRAGEKTGNLAFALQEIAVELERQKTFRKKILATVSYPAFLILAVFVVLFALGVWVLPVYENFFAGFDGEIPYLTQVIFSFGRLLPTFLAGISFSLAGIILFVRLKYPMNWSTLLIGWTKNIPYLGRVFILGDFVQMHRIMGSLLRSGVMLIEATELASNAVKTVTARNLTAQMVLAVKQGYSMIEVMRMEKEFPIEASEMLAVAEESGQLDQMFVNVAQMLSHQFEEKLQRLTRFMEPALILMMAMIVGMVAVGIYLPIIDATAQIH